MLEDNGVIYHVQLTILSRLCRFREKVEALKSETPVIPGEYELETVLAEFDDLLKEIRDQEYKQLVLLKTLHQKLGKVVDPYWQVKEPESAPQVESAQTASDTTDIYEIENSATKTVIGTVLDEAEADWYGPHFKKEATDV